MKGFRATVVVMSILMLTFGACLRWNEKSPEEINALLQTEGAHAFLIIDVRPAARYRGGHIAGAVNIPLESETFEQRLAGLEKDRRVIVYCGTGLKTEKAAAAMRDMGFRKVFVLRGGLDAWKKAGLELTQ
jgi:rhodanese-related sulfurtransferase